MIRRKQYGKDGQEQTTFYSYDDHHYPEHEMMINNTGDTLWRSMIDCDSAGRPIKVAGFGKKDTLLYTRYSFYNGIGKITREVTMLPKAKWAMNYEYDSLGRMISSTVSGSRQPGIYNMINSYDANGNLVKSVQSSYYYETVFTYEYDARGNRTKQNMITSFGKNEKPPFVTSFSYYPNGLFFESIYQEKKKSFNVQRVYYSYH